MIFFYYTMIYNLRSIAKSQKKIKESIFIFGLIFMKFENKRLPFCPFLKLEIDLNHVKKNNIENIHHWPKRIF